MTVAVDAAAKAALTSGDFIGVFLSSPANRWESVRLPSRAALADWYDDWQGNPGLFTFLAAFDKTSSPWKSNRAPILSVASEGFARFQDRPIAPPPESPASFADSLRHVFDLAYEGITAPISGAERSTTAMPHLTTKQKLTALDAMIGAHDVFWAELAQARPSGDLRSFLRDSWDPFLTQWRSVSADVPAWRDAELLAGGAQALSALREQAAYAGIPTLDLGTSRHGFERVGAPHGGGHGGGSFHGGGGFGGGRPRPPRWPGWGGGSWGAPWYGYGYPYYVYEVPEVIYETPVVYCEPGDPTCDPNAGADPAFVVSGDLTITVSHAGERLAGLACAGLFDSIGDAIGGAVHGVTNVMSSAVGTVSHTLGQLKGPIGAAASMAAAAGAAGIPGVGPLVAPLAGSLAKNIVDAAAGGADVRAASQQVVQQAAKQAQVNPQVATALTAAQRAVTQATAGYHAIQTAANAQAGNHDAQAQIAELHGAAQGGDAGAQDMIALARSFGEALSREDRGTVRDPNWQVDPNAIEIDAPAKSSGFVRLAGVREQASAAAKDFPARVIGVVQLADGQWSLQAFDSSDAADDWYGQWLALPHAFKYVAYYDRGDMTFPGPLNEAHGAPIGARIASSGGLLPVALALGIGGAAGYFGPDVYHWARGKLSHGKAA